MQVYMTLINNERHTQVCGGKRKLGRPKKRWKDQHPCRRNGPGTAYTLLLLQMIIYTGDRTTSGVASHRKCPQFSICTATIVLLHELRRASHLATVARLK